MGTRMLSGIVMLAAALPAFADEIGPAPRVIDEIIVTAKYPGRDAQALAELRAAIHDRLLDEAQLDRLELKESRDALGSDEPG